MAKSDHPAYGGKSTADQRGFEPHLLPSVLEEGVYFLHQSVNGNHETTMIRGVVEANAMLLAAIDKRRENT